MKSTRRALWGPGSDELPAENPNNGNQQKPDLGAIGIVISHKSTAPSDVEFVIALLNNNQLGDEKLILEATINFVMGVRFSPDIDLVKCSDELVNQLKLYQQRKQDILKPVLFRYCMSILMNNMDAFNKMAKAGTGFFKPDCPLKRYIESVCGNGISPQIPGCSPQGSPTKKG